MHEAVLIYPHQLVPTTHPCFAPGRPVYLAEEPLFLTEFPTHRGKLLLHRLSLTAFARELAAAGYLVHYLDVREYPTTAAIWQRVANDGYSIIHVPETTDDWLETRLSSATAEHHLTLVRYPSPLFLLPRGEAMERYTQSKRHLATFYKTLRRDRGILLTESGEPLGGRWSFDDENRKKLPRTVLLPQEPIFTTSDDTKAALAWLAYLPGEHYGEAAVWLPYTRAGAQAYLHDFLSTRFATFGPYEDAITTRGIRLFHSTLSPLLNIGLLSPHEVLDEVLTFAKANDIPFPSLEGFVRQLIGWREFIRAAYEVDGRMMRGKNFFKHSAPLPRGMWDATTGLPPLDHTITSALRFGYTHHIERLMVAGNYLLLTETNPHEVYRWFMAMYIDAYDWVMVPNVYGMSQFADGGSFATKPYISGSSYLTKMSDHPKGDWEDIWTALYWRFIDRHRPVFAANHRLSMMPKLYDKLDDGRKTTLSRIALHHLTVARPEH